MDCTCTSALRIVLGVEEVNTIERLRCINEHVKMAYHLQESLRCFSTVVLHHVNKDRVDEEVQHIVNVFSNHTDGMIFVEPTLSSEQSYVIDDDGENADSHERCVCSCGVHWAKTGDLHRLYCEYAQLVQGATLGRDRHSQRWHRPGGMTSDQDSVKLDHV